MKTAGAMSGITTACAIGTRMGETGHEHALGNLSSSEATLEDLKAVGETVPAMVKGAVKGVPGLNRDWQQEWATDPVGTAVGLLGLLGIGEGVSEGPAYLSGKTQVTDFLTKEGIPADQVADTFKAIEKAQRSGGTLNIGGAWPVNPRPLHRLHLSQETARKLKKPSRARSSQRPDCINNWPGTLKPPESLARSGMQLIILSQLARKMPSVPELCCRILTSP